MDFLRQGVAWLHEFRKRELVEACHYVRDGIYHPINLTLMREGTQVDADTGVIFNSREQDFYADPQDFTDLGLDPPERGDYIVRSINGTDIEYQVIGTENEPPYRASDRYNLCWRIHTVAETIVPPPAP